MLSPGQTFVACVANVSVGFESKERDFWYTQKRLPHRLKQSQHVNPTYRNICCARCDAGVVNCQLWANNPQHVAQCCNRMVKGTQHVATNNVAIVWRGLIIIIKHYNYYRRCLTTKIKVSVSVWNSHSTSLWTRCRKTNADSRFLMKKIIRSILT